jgi:hypothetical protein
MFSRIKIFIDDLHTFNRSIGFQIKNICGSLFSCGCEEVHNLYCSPNIIRVIKSGRMSWKGCVVHMKEVRNAYKSLVGKPEGKRPLGKSKCRWEGDIKMDLKEVGFEGVVWIPLRIGSSGRLL